jgi:two-component system response regulator PilR (NtrC family)
VASVLVVDDEQSMREFLTIFLTKDGHDVTANASVKEAIQTLGEREFELVISDLRMPDGSGLDVLRNVKERKQEAQVIIVTAYATMENAVEAMRLGAYDYQLKPFKLNEIRLVVQNALEKGALIRENRALKQQLSARKGALVGKSAPMQRVYELVDKVAKAKTNVIVTGESGTGKELVARAIHNASERAKGAFIAVNCGAIPEALVESELFGYKRGAFTGAVTDKAGLFEAAEGGTLFLDEIGELPQSMQVKLLRALQERVIKRVGAPEEKKIDVRVIAATHRELAEEVKGGRFREDLFYRLNVISIRLPPLRERKEDIALLAAHFVQKFAVEQKKEVSGFSPEALRLLLDYRFSGNVRELENIVERAITLSDGGVMDASVLPAEVTHVAEASQASIRIDGDNFSLEKTLDSIERRLLEEALEKTGGRKKKAATLLGLTFRSLRYRLEKHGMSGGADEGSDESE